MRISKIFLMLFVLVTISLCFSRCNRDPLLLESSITKSEYFKLSNTQKQTFWINRLSSFRDNVDISDTKTELINESIQMLKDYDLDKGLNYEMNNLAIQIAKNFDKGLFLSLFCSTDMEVHSSETDEICLQCLKDLQEYDYGEGNSTELRAPSDPPDCNCRWICSSPLPGTEMPCECVYDECIGSNTYQCCRGTLRGCGFFGLQACRHYAALDCDCQ